MLQTFIQFVQNNLLPINIIIGFSGFCCCMWADGIKNRELKKIIETSPKPADQESEELEYIELESLQEVTGPQNKNSVGSPDDKAHGRLNSNDSVPGSKDPKLPASALPKPIRRRVLKLNIYGYLLMFYAMAALWYNGYFDASLARFF